MTMTDRPRAPEADSFSQTALQAFAQEAHDTNMELASTRSHTNSRTEYPSRTEFPDFWFQVHRSGQPRVNEDGSFTFSSGVYCSNKNWGDLATCR